ncbi:MAG TPA: class I SAM-dependent methyltransferase [Candidatus Bathyarchaeia archaeon]|nr:class I SAM-dependent methyltransferase [Candidatus Bathyarchaeia archaeon]
MKEYYRKWAPDYEKFYYNCSPEIKQGNDFSAKLLQEYLSGRSVLEIACGTGYWTRILSKVAKNIIATDVLPEVLLFAKEKQYDCPVSFIINDAYDLSLFKNTFDGGLANFWFSHIPKERIDFFLTNFHHILQPKSRVFMTDNNPLHLPDGQLFSFPEDPNTYRLRTVSDGSEHYVLKNYYTIDDLVTIFSKHIKNFKKSNIYYDEYFWRLTYELP